MSQRELAKELNVNFTTVNRWEKKRIVPGKLARQSFYNFCKVRDIKIPPEIYIEDEEM